MLISGLLSGLLVILLTLAPIFSQFKVGNNLLLQDIFFFVFFLLSLSNFSLRFNARIIFFSVSLLLSLVSVYFIGFEHIRLVFAFCIGLLVHIIKGGEKILYISVRLGALLSSLYLILTLALFLILNVNISLDFGEYSLLPNTWSEIDAIEENSQIKLGGAFREPNWFAVYASMGLYSFLKSNDHLKLLIVIFALVIANSSYGHFLVGVSIFYWIIKSRSFNILILIATLAFILYSFLGFSFFERTLNSFQLAPDNASSYGVRIYYPWMDYFQNISLLPTSYETSSFANTGIVLLSVFGFLFGLIFVLILGFLSRFSLLFLFFVAAIILEGFYGRAEFAIYLSFLVSRIQHSSNHTHIF
jgi:hypothetical protein